MSSVSIATTPDAAREPEVRRLRTLYQLLAALSGASALEQVYDAALDSLMEATTANRAAILLVDDDGAIRFKAWRGLSEEFIASVPVQLPWLRELREAHSVVITDAADDGQFARYREVLTPEGVDSLAFVPLVLHADLIGSFILFYDRAHVCTVDELEVAEAIASHVVLATERKQLEIARQYLAAIVESSDDAIASKDLNGIITSWNEGAERLFGYTAEEVMGKPVSILAVPGHNEMPAILAQIRQGHRVDHYETQRRRKDGKIIDIALTVSPIRDSAGHIIGASKVARNITDRKLAEEERTQLLLREKEARRTAELLNLLAPRLLAELDLAKLTQEVIDIATTLAGAEFGAFFHNVVSDDGESYALQAVSGASKEAFAALSMRGNTELFASTFHGESVVRCDDVTADPRHAKGLPQAIPNGHPLVRSYLAAPVVARSGEVLGVLFFGHSLSGKFTETHEAIIRGIAAQAAIAMDNARLFEQAQWVQTELKRSNEELRRANRDLEVFAYSASHDLKDPLRTISISAQLIERNCREQLTEENAAFLTNILHAASRMNTLMQDLLAYTSAAKREQLPAAIADSGKVLAGVLESLSGPIEEAGAEVTSGDLPVVAIHESRLGQILQNLISNAIKYRSESPPRIHVTATEEDGWWVFSVADNGIGIEPQFAEQIFGLFKRLHSRDEYPGSGVGLSICQRILDQYGGRIWLEHSVPGRGSTFSFAIPVRPLESAEERHPS